MTVQHGKQKGERSLPASGDAFSTDCANETHAGGRRGSRSQRRRVVRKRRLVLHDKVTSLDETPPPNGTDSTHTLRPIGSQTPNHIATETLLLSR